MESRQEWLKWRHKGIGGSDLPIILGDSPYKTRLQLYDEKILPEPPPEQSNFILDRGNEFEPKIRSLFNLTKGRNFVPALIESAQLDFARCSLDGKDGDEMLEIKTAGKEDHEGVKKGIMPKKYKAQVQWCLMIAGLKKCYYLSYYDPEWNRQVKLENLEMIEVVSEPEYQAMLLKEATEFWECVVKRKPPVPTDKDYKPLTGLSATAKKWIATKKKIEELEQKLDEYRSQIIAEAEKQGHPRFMCAGIRMIQTSRVGNVQYAKIPELKGVDLDKYRGPGSVSWKMEIIEK